MINQSEIKKLSGFYRGVAFFICFFCFIALVGVLSFALKEKFSFSIFPGVLVPSLFIYVFFPIFVKGYPPKILLWTMSRDKSI